MVTNAVNVEVICDPDSASYTNTLVAGTTLTVDQDKASGNQCYYTVSKSNLVASSDCPITLQAFISLTDTTTQVSQYTGYLGASDVFIESFRSSQNFYYFDGIDHTFVSG